MYPKVVRLAMGGLGVKGGFFLLADAKRKILSFTQECPPKNVQKKHFSGY